jgi:hypothetical protein
MQKTRVLQKNAGYTKQSKTTVSSGCSLHVWSFGAADDQFPAKEFLVMEFLDGPTRFLDGCHLNERKAFGSLRILVANDLSISNLADAIKQLEKIALRRIE